MERKEKRYNVCLEKGSDDNGSAGCDTIYLTIPRKQTAAPISSEPFSTYTLYMKRNYITKTKLYFNYTNPQDGSQNVVRL